VEAAETKIAEGFSIRLAAEAQFLLGSGDALSALPLAIAANTNARPPSASQLMLSQISNAARLRKQFEQLGVAVFTPDGKRVVGGNAHGLISVEEVASGDTVQEFQAHNLPIVSLAISADGTMLASMANDSSLRLWNLDTGALLRIRWKSSWD
jgi:WD40 repeat protein